MNKEHTALNNVINPEWKKKIKKKKSKEKLIWHETDPEMKNELLLHLKEMIFHLFNGRKNGDEEKKKSFTLHTQKNLVTSLQHIWQLSSCTWRFVT